MRSITETEITTEDGFIDDGLEYKHGRSPGNTDERKQGSRNNDCSTAMTRGPREQRCRPAENKRPYRSQNSPNHCPN